MKQLCVSLIALTLFITDAIGQTYSLYSHVLLRRNRTFFRDIKVGVAEIVPPGNNLQIEVVKQNGDSTFKYVSTIPPGTLVSRAQSSGVQGDGLRSKVTLIPDEKDKSKLYINHYIFPDFNPNRFDNKTPTGVVTRHLYSFNSIPGPTPGTFAVVRVFATSTPVLMTNYEGYYYPGVQLFGNALNHVVESLRIEYSDGTSEYIYKYSDSPTEYYLKLDNREFISLPKRSWDFGPITIPFKFRWGYSNDSLIFKNSDDTIKRAPIRDDVSLDFNIGLFGGWSFGRYRVRAEGKELKNLASLNCTLGWTLGVSAITLDSKNTSHKFDNFKGDDKTSAMVLSTGPAVMISLYNFKFLVAYGWDNTLGSYARYWNYKGRPWLGLGVGYTLNYGFWKS